MMDGAWDQRPRRRRQWVTGCLVDLDPGDRTRCHTARDSVGTPAGDNAIAVVLAVASAISGDLHAGAEGTLLKMLVAKNKEARALQASVAQGAVDDVVVVVVAVAVD
jgi:hypothetical protein